MCGASASRQAAPCRAGRRASPARAGTRASVLPAPRPAPGNGGLDGDAGRLLADARDRRDGGGEVDDDRVRALVVSICVRGGGTICAVETTGSTRSGVRPCHHFSTCGLANQPASTSNSQHDQPGQPLLQPLQPEKKKAPTMRSHPGGRQEPMSPACQRTQEAERTAQSGEEHVAERREFSIGDLKHGSSPLFLLAPGSLLRAACEAMALCVKSS
jgi:hypothetical protein